MPASTNERAASRQIPRPRRNGELTRRRLLRCAIRLFSARGYDGVALDDVVRVARVDKALVYHYFDGKEGLYRAALQDVYRRPDAVEHGALQAGASTCEKLARLLEAMAGFLEKHPEYVRMLLWENLEKGRHLHRGERILGKSFFPDFANIIQDGIARRELHAELEPAHLFINFIGLCFIYHLNRRFLAQEVGLDLSDPRIRAEGVRQAVRLVLQGVARG